MRVPQDPHLLFTDFRNIFSSTKSANPPISAPSHSGFSPPPRDNQVEEKVAGRRATNPVSATHFRPRGANFSVCNKALAKTGNAFPESRHGLAKTFRSRFLSGLAAHPAA